MTDEELTILIRGAGLSPPPAGYTETWSMATARWLVDGTRVPSMAQRVALAAILQRLNTPGVSITYKQAMRFLGMDGDP